MSITTKFRTQSGEVSSRNFPLNTGVSVFGKVTGAVGLGEPGTAVRMEVTGENVSVFGETNANAYGDYSFYFLTPSIPGRATITIFASYSVSGQDKTIIPIAFGTIQPDTLPAPEEENAIAQLFASVNSTIFLLLLIGLLLYFSKKKGYI